VDAARANAVGDPMSCAARLIHPTVPTGHCVHLSGSGHDHRSPSTWFRQESRISTYRRVFSPGGTYFFTLVTWRRRHLLASEERVALLREAFAHIKRERPFSVDAAVILPEHLHCILRLPHGDSDYPGRWREIKKRFSGRVDTRTNLHGERPVWQRRYYEHLVRDDEDWRRHMDYIHYNPVKHGLVERVADWPWSSFRQSVARGWYPEDWGSIAPAAIEGVELE